MRNLRVLVKLIITNRLPDIIDDMVMIVIDIL